MAKQYRTEDVAKTPRGYRVRSVLSGDHVVRVAFPPGPRKKGSGRVVQLLHPRTENPQCPPQADAPRAHNALIESILGGAAAGTAVIAAQEGIKWYRGRKGRKAKPFGSAQGRLENRKAGHSNPGISRPDLRRMRELTIAAWWSSRAFPKPHPRWHMIASELKSLAEDEAFRGDEKRSQEAIRLARLAEKEAQTLGLGGRGPAGKSGAGNPKQARAWQPFFILSSGVERFGFEHPTQKEAWKEVSEILADKSIEWVREPGAIKDYGIQRVISGRGPTGKSGAGNPPSPRRGGLRRAGPHTNAQLRRGSAGKPLKKVMEEEKATFWEPVAGGGARIYDRTGRLIRHVGGTELTMREERIRRGSRVAGRGNPRIKTVGKITASEIVKAQREGVDWLLGPDPLSPSREIGIKVQAYGPEFIARLTAKDISRIGKNPRTGLRLGPAGRGNQGDNGQAAARSAYQEFHGRAPQQLIEMQEALLRSGDYWSLGKLSGLWLFPVKGDVNKWPPPSIEPDDADDEIFVAADPKTTQLYLVGGNQRLSHEDLKALSRQADTSKRFIPLGCVYAIGYVAQKRFDNFRDADYRHEFGEETGERPFAYYDQEAGRLVLVGGAYKIAPPEGAMRISPGIVN